MAEKTSFDKRQALQKIIASKDWEEKSPKIFDQMKRLGKSLSDRTRIRIILELIKRNYSSVSSLSKKIAGIDEKTFYYHYDILKKAGLIDSSEKGIGKKLKRGNLVLPSNFAIDLIHDVLVPHPGYARAWIPIPRRSSIRREITSVERPDEVQFDNAIIYGSLSFRELLDREVLPRSVLEKTKLIFLDEEVLHALDELYKKSEMIFVVLPKGSKNEMLWKSVQRTCPGDTDEEIMFYAFGKMLATIDVPENERLVQHLRQLKTIRSELDGLGWNEWDIIEALKPIAEDLIKDVAANQKEEAKSQVESIEQIAKKLAGLDEKKKMLEQEIDSRMEEIDLIPDVFSFEMPEDKLEIPKENMEKLFEYFESGKFHKDIQESQRKREELEESCGMNKLSGEISRTEEKFVSQVHEVIDLLAGVLLKELGCNDDETELRLKRLDSGRIFKSFLKEQVEERTCARERKD